jgi:hypothetical protein
MAPTPTEFATRWRRLSEEVTAGTEDWRLHHSQGSLQEVKGFVDEYLRRSIYGQTNSAPRSRQRWA